MYADIQETATKTVQSETLAILVGVQKFRTLVN